MSSLTSPEGAAREIADPADTPEATTQQAPSSNTDAGTDLAAQHTERVQELLQRIADMFSARLTYDRAKEAAFDRLYADFDALRRDAAGETVRPILLDLILLYDRMESTHQQLLSVGGPGASISIETLRSFTAELLEVLARRDVELVPNLSASFDPSHQRAVGVEPAEDASHHHEVVRIVRRGFRHRERILRPEDVIVRRFAPPPRSDSKRDRVLDTGRTTP